MIAVLSSFVIGTIFGAGLAISQMINPAKIIGFLDFAGDWDPTLAVVMAGALIVTVPAFAVTKKRRSPILDQGFHLPEHRNVDWRLIAGSSIFGLGWGMAGFCPGPAIAAMSTGLWQVFLFVLAMLVGAAGYRFLSVWSES